MTIVTIAAAAAAAAAHGGFVAIILLSRVGIIQILVDQSSVTTFKTKPDRIRRLIQFVDEAHYHYQLHL